MICRVLLVTIAIFAASALPTQAKPSPISKETITLIIKASPAAELQTELSLRSAVWVKGMRQLALKPETATDYHIIASDAQVDVKGSEGSVSYRVLPDGTLLRISDGALFAASANFTKTLTATIQKLRNRHYGEMLPWSRVKDLVPRKAKFTVIDIETGLRFHVQRRAGAEHADVQPLTKADTAIMNSIYGGVWSWDRRAVLVKTEQGIIAGSMHGMPHGGDGIPDNDFSGHFCIHFYESVTHGTGSLDPAHQAMVHKAAGKLQDYVDSLTARGTIDLLMVSINQKDSLLLTLLSADNASYSSLSQAWLDTSIKKARLLNEPPDSANERGTSLTLPIRVSLWTSRTKAETKRLLVQLSRSSEQAPWKISGIELADR